MSFDEKLKELREKESLISKLKSEIVDASAGLFDEFREHIFLKYPKLNSFGWTQYTPYFNDGDACLFYANTDYLMINDEYAEDSEWFSKNKIISWGQWNQDIKSYEGRVEEPNTQFDEDLLNAYDDIALFLGNFGNDFYLTKFGDHAEITVTKSSVDISDYDHD